MQKRTGDTPSTFKKYKNYLLLATGIIGAIAVLLSNLTAINTFFKTLTHKTKDDLVIVDTHVNDASAIDTVQENQELQDSLATKKDKAVSDNKDSASTLKSKTRSPASSIDAFLSKDTVEFRILNKGSQTVALREAQIIVDSCWEIARFNCYAGFDFLSQVYQVPLFDLQKPYMLKVQLEQSIKPNEVDRFAFVLGGGAKIDASEKEIQVIYEMHRKGLDKNITVKGFKQQSYFLKFKVRFFLNNSSDYIETNSLIHYFGNLTDISKDAALRCKDHALLKLVDLNHEIAERIAHLNFYKSSTALIAIQRLSL